MEFDPQKMRNVEIARIRRNRQLSVEEILKQHDEAIRSVLECMRAAEASELHSTGESSSE